VITCITAQNPKEIVAVQVCRPSIVREQISAVFEELPPVAIKTGMLYTAGNVRIVANWLADCRARPRLVVDPVAVATSGRSLLQARAAECLRRELLPLASLVTPNLSEAEALAGFPILEPEQMRQAARSIYKAFGCAVLVKGGHLPETRQALDIFYDGETELLLAAPFVKGLSLHGAGCTYSAAITAFLALGCELPEAVRRGKVCITNAIARSARAGVHGVLGAC
jgi:hydroxymethylpyrimidine kinase/phosphomethylpyrimidine kinase